MNAIQFHDLLLMPWAMTAIGAVIVLLMALTMNAVVKRERAMMVRVSRDASARLAYLRRWGRGEPPAPTAR
ncbi:MAG: hypothetical protein K0U76_09855 [Actinomycetia bacterium]|nr:hypothetical protein [Actinomycetes bacterium]MCH9701682.1 hypothetical protein [Actinomycetes bacterium]MCH9760332.1 hypothetical protein [Actinomycetes bacterium]